MFVASTAVADDTPPFKTTTKRDTDRAEVTRFHEPSLGIRI